MQPAQLSIIFFLELFAIVLTARTVGWPLTAGAKAR
jgi:hypothetical protein